LIDTNERGDIQEFQKEIRFHFTNLLERDYSELCLDIDFLEAQIKSDSESYSPKDLERANEKISFCKKMLQTMKFELKNRQN